MPYIHPLFLSPSSRVLRGYRDISAVLNDTERFLSNLNLEPEESETAYMWVFALPGFKKTDVSVAVTDGTIRVWTDHNVVPKGVGSVVRLRTITLPSDADSTKVEAKLEDGLLTLTVAKLVAVQPRKVVIS